MKRIQEICKGAEVEVIEGEILQMITSGKRQENLDDSEKIGEILDPKEHEIWEENIRDFDENEFENNNENVINTEGFGLSQNSDSNNSLNIEDSDTESENELLNMANQDQIKRIIENAVRLTANALDHALGQDKL
ncbi:hypothetical protein RhiirA4_428433 [Rhizophagus irregularis]|uniref:Uncharacterized protein n=1 Tax=Rhizophagus irregularis TaxID=588596 RepID=A0A2I1HCY2_9GLOM|nr:hypothetical protein RhiirA4_428433 [Rhizophagus irregularis]